MYSVLENVQIIIALMKKYEIKDVVISAGTKHVPLVHSLEEDTYFRCYSVVDERSASFFALGIIEEKQKPVAICCTSGTATCNYVSAVSEAYYQHLPLLVITADRNPYYLNQQEEQMIPQREMFQQICRKEVMLPIVRDTKDFWYCSRLVNEALLELEHKECGPVHINFAVENDYPVYQGIVKFKDELPSVRRINRLTLESSERDWKEKVEKCYGKKILILYGQRGRLADEELQNLEQFAHKFDCVFSVDLLSNLHCFKSISTFLLNRTLSIEEFENVMPDIVITLNGNTVSELKGKLLHASGKFEHWHVSRDGEVSDPFRCMTDIIECSPEMFYKKFAELSDQERTDSYYDSWMNIYKKRREKGLPDNREIHWSSLYAVQQLMKRMPEKALFHIANSNSIRIANFFSLDPTIDVFCNRGTNGIDGSMSAFVGQAFSSKKLSFLLIGDLSFFYDMNALWNQYITKNIRIMVCNNFGGAIFHIYPGLTNIPTIDKYIAAEHDASVEKWAVSRGFYYLSASTKEEYDVNIIEFMNSYSDKPVLFEVFTDKEQDQREIKAMSSYYMDAANKLSRLVSERISPKTKQKLIEIHHKFSKR